MSRWKRLRSAANTRARSSAPAQAAEVLLRKRASFLVTATEQYGVELAEVFALFLLHSAFDDDLRNLLALLAHHKQLSETLGRMGTVLKVLQRRGLDLSEYPDRAERAEDALRGLGRAARDALATIPLVAEPRYTDFAAKRGQLPPPYQQALDEVERALMARHHAPANVALSSFDALTFGVPMGFYHLAAGTSQGAASLAQGRYEQASRELAPAALLVGLYAGGKGARHLFETTGTARGAVPRLRLPAMEAVPAVGAYLGEVLVRHLGGEWIARQKLEEAQVRVGSRVWLPFVRAHRYMRSRQALLDFSLTQLYRVAARHRA